MKIVICGSNAFRQQMVDYQEKLEQIGHEAIIHPHYIQFVKGGRRDILDRIDKGEHAQVKKENDYIRWYHRAIKNSDAVLILNFKKRDIENYIGGNTLMEIAFAYVNNKNIFLINPIPSKLNYKDEIEAMEPIILEGDLSRLYNNHSNPKQKTCDHKSVGILVFRDDELLLIERKKFPFGFAPPAGHVDEHGSFEEAARNELKEEVGLDALNLKLVKEGRKENPCRRGSTWHYWKIYQTEVQGKIKPSKEETKQAGWYDRGALQQLADRTKDYLAKAIKEEDWQEQPGLEPVWHDWLSELGIIK